MLFLLSHRSVIFSQGIPVPSIKVQSMRGSNEALSEILPSRALNNHPSQARLLRVSLSHWLLFTREYVFHPAASYVSRNEKKAI